MNTRDALKNVGLSDKEIQFVLDRLGPLTEWDLDLVELLFSELECSVHEIVTEIEFIREMNVWPEEVI